MIDLFNCHDYKKPPDAHIIRSTLSPSGYPHLAKQEGRRGIKSDSSDVCCFVLGYHQSVNLASRYEVFQKE